MEWAVAAGALLLAFVDGANDDMKGAATHSRGVLEGDSLAPRQDELELRYESELRRHQGIEFHRLLAIANVPIER